MNWLPSGALAGGVLLAGASVAQAQIDDVCSRPVTLFTSSSESVVSRVVTLFNGSAESAVSRAVTLYVYCPADIDDDGDYTTGLNPDGGVDINDLLAFLDAFEAGDLSADLDDGNGGGVSDGGVDINDLLFFLAHFESGC